METVSFLISEEIRDKIIHVYHDYQQDNRGDYIDFFAKYEDITITIYHSKKGYKVLFSGNGCLNEAKIFNPNASLNVTKQKVKTSFIDLSSQIGSDEVGFGDFFGPLVVVASYYDESLANELSHIDDSKKITDEWILTFVPTILNRVTFSKLTVHNPKYNTLLAKGYNMNQIKAKLHNQALLNVAKKMKDCNTFYVDQFCEPSLYYHYLEQDKEVIQNITFHTKGESYYPSVALASMIARYCFLKEMEVLSKKYNMEFPKGASLSVDRFAEEFVKKYGMNELAKVCKTNFINYKNLLMKK